MIRAGVRVPSMKVLKELVRDDGKRFDGLTLLPWNSGRSATWDVTVVDTLGSAYLQQSAITGASATETAAARKINNYSSLSWIYDFFPVALETLGPPWVSVLKSSWCKTVGVWLHWRLTLEKPTFFSNVVRRRPAIQSGLPRSPPRANQSILLFPSQYFNR